MAKNIIPHQIQYNPFIDTLLITVLSVDKLLKKSDNIKNNITITEKLSLFS